MREARRSERETGVFELRFGREKADRAGRTANLSLGGMFVVTSDPLGAGSLVRLSVQLGKFSVPLSGRVVWVRPRIADGPLPGMGIELLNVPPMYRRFIATLHAESRRTDGSGVTER